MTSDRLSLGEYIRRLRRQAKRSLYSLAQETHISYSHLSRIENDSTVPNADTVARIATALDGDLKVMLEMAKCLPRAILDRIVAREEAGSPSSLRRALAHEPNGAAQPAELGAAVTDLALAAGLDENEVSDILEAVSHLIRLGPTRRSTLTSLIRSLYEERDEKPG